MNEGLPENWGIVYYSLIVDGRRGYIEYHVCGAQCYLEMIARCIGYAKEHINPQINNCGIEFMKKLLNTIKNKDERIEGKTFIQLGIEKENECLQLLSIGKPNKRIYIKSGKYAKANKIKQLDSNS